MNKIITIYVKYRGSTISVEELKDNSNIKVEVECKHGRRFVRWSRRNQLCRKCVAEQGSYSTSKLDREITWGDKISKSKTGVKLSKEHKSALNDARITKYCKKIGIIESDFKGFPTAGVQYKLRNKLMSSINKNIRKTSVEEQDNLFIKELGYSVFQLKVHLESKWTPEMSWENYGEYWHIDHVIPDSWFSYDSTEDEKFKECWALNNLQPMLAIENMQKGNRYRGEHKKKIIYMLCGQFGVGKTTLANKMTNKFTIINADKYPNQKKRHKVIIDNLYNDKPILLDIPTMIITFYNRYKDMGYEIIPIFIIEDIGVVEDRLRKRDGKITKTIESRWKRMQSLKNNIGVFYGDFNEVYDYLIKLEL